MRQRIRLTESGLHRIIKESVKRVLNEMDWRTFDSASEKAFQTKTKTEPNMFGDDCVVRDMDLVNKFRKAKADALNKKFFDGKDEKTYFPNGGNFANGEFDMEPSVYNGKISYRAGDDYSDSPVQYHGSGAFTGNYTGSAKYEDVLDAFNGDEEKARHFWNLCQEIHDYKRGKTKYKKGEGWQ